MRRVEERVADALERIADALEQQNAMLAPMPTGGVDEAPCLHPKDDWLDMSTMGHARGKCGVCGFSIGMES